MRRGKNSTKGKKYGVSIHAPARGATVFGDCVAYVKSRFNSRTREGCDGAFVGGYALIILFQFTHPRGVRLAILKKNDKDKHVSIHAPARGATNHQRGI